MCRGWSRHQHSPSPTCRPAQPNWQIHLGNQQHAKERVKLRRLQTADFNFISVALHSVWFLLSDCLSDGRLSQIISKPRSFPPQKPAQQFDALLLSPGLSWDHLPRLKTKVVRSKVKGTDWKLRQYSSMDKSWGQGRLPHSPWSWMERCRLPWSRHLPSGCLECRCNIKHQLMLETSYLVQVYATCMCLPKRKGKWVLPKKILPRLWTTIWQRGTLWKTLFQNKSSGTINPVYLPQNSWTTQRMCQSTKHCLVQLLPNTLSCNLWGTSHEQQWHRVALAQHLLYHSKGEMLRREQSKGHSKGTRAWQKNIQSL